MVETHEWSEHPDFSPEFATEEQLRRHLDEAHGIGLVRSWRDLDATHHWVHGIQTLETQIAAEQARIDVDKLPARQYLVLELLAARYRLGEDVWHFPQSATLKQTLDNLSDRHLICYQQGTHRTVTAWLTDLGKRSTRVDDYVPPVQQAEGSTPPGMVDLEELKTALRGLPWWHDDRTKDGQAINVNSTEADPLNTADKLFSILGFYRSRLVEKQVEWERLQAERVRIRRGYTEIGEALRFRS